MKSCKLAPLVLLFLLIFSSFTPPKEITMTTLGDSFTYLNDHLNESDGRVTKGWITRTKELVPGLTYTNEGRNYWTSVEVAEKIESFNLEPSDIYTIFLGTNDWWLGVRLGTIDDYTNNTGVGTMCGSFRKIIDKLHSVNSGAHIILITPMQRGDFVYVLNSRVHSWGSYKDKDGQSLKSFADAIKEIAKKEGFELVDLYNEPRLSIRSAVKFKYMRDPQTFQYKEFPYPDYVNIAYDDSEEYPYPKSAIDNTYDGIHPSDKGNAIIAGLLAKVIKGIEF